MGVYVLVFPCISVDVCAYKSASVCVMVEVSFGNRLIITAAPSFIIFIEFFPASALGACKSYKFNTTGCRAFTVCVCTRVFIWLPSPVHWVLTTSTNQRSDPALFRRKSPNFVTSVSIVPRKGWRKAFRRNTFHQSGYQLLALSLMSWMSSSCSPIYIISLGVKVFWCPMHWIMGKN